MAAQITSTLRHAVGTSLRRSPEPVQTALRRGSRRVLAALGAPDTDAPPAPAAQVPPQAPVWTSPDVPVPDGLTYDQVLAALQTWSIDGEPPGHMDMYLFESVCRLLHTWSLARNLTGTALELGANPYFETYLLDNHTALDLTLANYFGESGETTQTLSYVPPGANDRVEIERRSTLFNVEGENFPFPDDSFDVVFFCEMLEHLLMDPLATLAEIHRVLKPGGSMVLTTPNAVRLDISFTIVDGHNTFDQYSGFGPYGRHNREYTQHELHRLLEFAGFDIDEAFSADGHRFHPEGDSRYAKVAPILAERDGVLGQYLFVRAHAARPAREGFPSLLYRSYPADQIIDFQ